MKYLLFFALTLLSVNLSAQKTKTTVTSTSTSVAESETNDSYTFKLKVDRRQMDDVVAAYLKITESTGISKIVGASTYTNDDGAVVHLNTRKRTLSVSGNKDQPASRSSARKIATEFREELDLAPAPAPGLD